MELVVALLESGVMKMNFETFNIVATCLEIMISFLGLTITIVKAIIQKK
jgi:hypothetical protein